MKSAGFLLIEVALVIALILVVITLALPQFSFLKRQIAQSEIQKFMAECLYQRMCAMATHQELTLFFDQALSQYGTKERMQTLSHGLQFGFLPTLLGPPSQPKHLIDKAITFAHNTIKFYADGTMSSGTVYFLDAQNKSSYAVTIPSGQAPFIRHYEYLDRWVMLS